jgi:hypothetical protein
MEVKKDMEGKKKGVEGATRDGVLDLRHTGVTRLNIPQGKRIWKPPLTT